MIPRHSSRFKRRTKHSRNIADPSANFIAGGWARAQRVPAGSPKCYSRNAVNIHVNSVLKAAEMRGNWPCLFKAMGACSQKPGGKPCGKCDAAKRAKPPDDVLAPVVGRLSGGGGRAGAGGA